MLSPLCHADIANEYLRSAGEVRRSERENETRMIVSVLRYFCLGSAGLFLPLLDAIHAQLCHLRGPVIPVSKGLRRFLEADILLVQEVKMKFNILHRHEPVN